MSYREEDIQKEQYDRIARDYQLHYGDEFSQEYRRRFMFQPMIEGLSLDGMKALDAMCGSGESSGHLLSAGAHVTGLDISPAVIDQFKERLPGCPVIKGSILDTGFKAESLDLVCVFGGLHHLHPHVHQAVSEIERILKPGGYFIFTEPTSGSLMERLRRLWYRYDNLFAENEAGIDLQGLKSAFYDRFAFEVERYGGSFAYLLVLNSMVFRIPHRWKAYYSRPMMTLERMIEPFQGELLSCSAVCRWRKTSRVIASESNESM